MVSALAFLAALAPESGLVYGEGCAYFVTAPKGWTLDAESGKSDGVPVCFYPNGGSWKDSATVMYSRSVPKKGRTLDGFIAGDLRDLRRADARVRTEPSPSLKAGGGTAKVLDFWHNQGASRERVAYLAAPKAFVLFVLTTKDEKDLARSVPSFESLVRSYRYFGEAKVDKP